MAAHHGDAFVAELLKFLPSICDEEPFANLVEVLRRGESLAIRAPPRIANSGATLAAYVSTKNARQACLGALYTALLPVAMLSAPPRIMKDKKSPADLAALRRARALKPKRALGYASLGLTPAAPRWAVLHAQAESELAQQNAGVAVAPGAMESESSDDGEGEAAGAGGRTSGSSRLPKDAQTAAFAVAAKTAAESPYLLSVALVVTSDYENTVRAMRALHELSDCLDAAAAAEAEQVASGAVRGGRAAKRVAKSGRSTTPPSARGSKAIAPAGGADHVVVGGGTAASPLLNKRRRLLKETHKAAEVTGAVAVKGKGAKAAAEGAEGAAGARARSRSLSTVSFADADADGGDGTPPPACALEIVHVAPASKSGKSAAQQVAEAIRRDNDPMQTLLPSHASPDDFTLARKRERQAKALPRARRLVLVGTPGSLLSLTETAAGKEACARVVVTVLVGCDDIVQWGRTIEQLGAAVQAGARRAELGIPAPIVTSTFAVLSKPVRRALTVFGDGDPKKGPVVVESPSRSADSMKTAQRLTLHTAEVPVLNRFTSMVALLKTAVAVRRGRAVVVCGTSASAQWYADVVIKTEALTVGTRRPTDPMSEVPDELGVKEAAVVSLRGRLLDAGISDAADEWTSASTGVLFAPIHDIVCLEINSVPAPAPRTTAVAAAPLPPRKKGAAPRAAAAAAAPAGTRQVVWVCTNLDARAVAEVTSARIGCAVEPLEASVVGRLVTRAKTLHPELETLLNEDYAACKGARDACRAVAQRFVELSTTGAYAWIECRKVLKQFAESFGMPAAPAVRAWLVDTPFGVEGVEMAPVLAHNPRAPRDPKEPLVPKRKKAARAVTA